MDTLSTCSVLDSMLNSMSLFTHSHSPCFYLKLASPCGLSIPFLLPCSRPWPIAYLLKSLWVESSPNSAPSPLRQPSHLFPGSLANSPQAKDLTPAPSAPSSGNLAPPQKTVKPYPSIAKSGLKTLLYPTRPLPGAQHSLYVKYLYF